MHSTWEERYSSSLNTCVYKYTDGAAVGGSKYAAAASKVAGAYLFKSTGIERAHNLLDDGDDITQWSCTSLPK
jgi:hypothetical protein